MPITNLKAIQTVTVGAGGASSISFTSIPQTYTDLVILLSGRQSAVGGTNVNMTFNGSTSAYTNTDVISAAGTAVSERTVLGTSSIKIGFIPDNTNYTTSTFSNQYVYIPNYAGSNNKSVSTDNVMENNSTSVYFGLFAGLWSNSSAITSIVLTCENGNFVQHSTATLYGITNIASPGAKATGGYITETATHWIHTFNSSDTFVPSQTLTCDYLVVAGGGSGGGSQGYSGGGGAGGLRSTVSATGGGGSLESAFTANNGTTYTITVGAGGSGASSGANGSNSSIAGSGLSTITSTGGGEGGYYNGSAYVGAASGGSGGGGHQSGGGSTGGARTVNQGYAGGNGNGGAGGGGGGAGAIGQDGATGALVPTGGNGGAGVAVAITGTSIYYAGGGGGGAQQGSVGIGGIGGGGSANYNGKVGFAGAIATGSGGGGSGPVASAGGNGGSGVVIIRYAK